MRRMGVRGGDASRRVPAASIEVREAVRATGQWQATAAGERTAPAVVRTSVRAGAVKAWLEQQVVAGLMREDGVAAAWSWPSDTAFGQQPIGSQFAADTGAHRQSPATCINTEKMMARTPPCRACRARARRRCGGRAKGTPGRCLPPGAKTIWHAGDTIHLRLPF